MSHIVYVVFSRKKFLQKSPQYFQFLINVFYLSGDDLLVDLNRLISKEWRVPRSHFIDQHSQRPPIDGLVVSLGQDDFWGQILWGTTQRPRPSLHSFREPEIGNLQVSVVVNQKILRLQISVDQVQRVQILERQHDLSGVEAGVGFAETADSPQMREHLTATNELEDHVEIGVVLEGVLHVDQEREVDGLKNAFLVQRVLHLFELHHLLLVQNLHGVVDFALFVFYQHDAAKGARSECFDSVEIVQIGSVLKNERLIQ